MAKSIEEFVNSLTAYNLVKDEYSKALDLYNSKGKSFDSNIEKMTLERIISIESNKMNFIGFWGTMLSLITTIVVTGLFTLINIEIYRQDSADIIFLNLKIIVLVYGVFVIGIMIIYYFVKSLYQKNINYANICLRALSNSEDNNDSKLKKGTEIIANDDKNNVILHNRISLDEKFKIFIYKNEYKKFFNRTITIKCDRLEKIMDSIYKIYNDNIKNDNEYKHEIKRLNCIINGYNISDFTSEIVLIITVFIQIVSVALEKMNVNTNGKDFFLSLNFVFNFTLILIVIIVINKALSDLSIRNKKGFYNLCLNTLNEIDGEKFNNGK